MGEVVEVDVEGEGVGGRGRRCAFEAMRRIVFSMLMLGLMLGSRVLSSCTDERITKVSGAASSLSTFLPRSEATARDAIFFSALSRRLEITLGAFDGPAGRRPAGDGDPPSDSSRLSWEPRDIPDWGKERARRAGGSRGRAGRRGRRGRGGLGRRRTSEPVCDDV